MDEHLVRAVNRGWLKRKDIPIALISPRLSFIRLAKEISREYKNTKEYRTVKQQNVNNVKSVALSAYEGSNPYVLRMIDFLKKHLKDDLAMACVHGSLGTYEEIAYSDFDALAVIKSEVFDDPKRLALTMYNLFNAQRIMFDLDPLQHHGWFILTEADYDAFPEYYFPSVLFEHAKSLLDDAGIIRKIKFIENKEKTRQAFLLTVASITSYAEFRIRPKNLYRLKSILSQMLLLPSMYVHCREGKAVFKKFSFALAQKDFSVEDWSIFDEVTSVRDHWCSEFSNWRKLLLSMNATWNGFLNKRLSPKVPKELSALFNKAFFRKFIELTNKMQKRIIDLSY